MLGLAGYATMLSQKAKKRQQEAFQRELEEEQLKRTAEAQKFIAAAMEEEENAPAMEEEENAPAMEEEVEGEEEKKLEIVETSPPPEEVKKAPKKQDAFHCHVCSVVFNRKYNRDRHMEVVHKVPRPGRPPLYPKMLENATPILTPPRAESMYPPEPAVKKIKTTEGEKKPPKDGDLEVTQLPMQTETTGRAMTPSLSIHFCGTCNYNNNHHYILLNNGEALVMVPICQKCNQLNLLISKTLKKFQKSLKEETE